jgi:uncharacterized protein YjiS (DUF1127 family)
LESKETIMRDYEINEAQSRQAYGRLTWVVRMIRNWRMRKDLKRLQGFSDYQLRDIGITRDQLHHLICLPLDTDMTWEAERSALMHIKYENVNTPLLTLLPTGKVASHKAKVPAWMTPPPDAPLNISEK